MRAKHRWLLNWIVIGAFVGVVPALLEGISDIHCWQSGPVLF